jgi:hypothetical protein
MMVLRYLDDKEGSSLSWWDGGVDKHKGTIRQKKKWNLLDLWGGKKSKTTTANGATER